MATDNPLPLAGKRVVVTRAPEQAGDLTRRLKALGAEVLLLPTVRFLEPEDPVPLDRAIGQWTTFDWVLFTSQNAVWFLVERCDVLRVAPRSLNAAKTLVGVVGPATAEAARAAGLRVDRVASRYRGEALAEELASELAGKKVLLPRSDRASDDLPRMLKAAGARVAEVVAYRTASPEPADAGVLEQIRRGEVDVITLASPSAFHQLAEEAGADRLRELAGRVLLAAIGPVTAAAMRAAGLPVAIEAASSTSEGLVAAIANHFAQRLPSGAIQP